MTYETLTQELNETVSNSMRTIEERRRIVAEREERAEYERGRQHAVNVMRTLGINDACKDLRLLVASMASAQYTAGYCDTVLAAVDR